MPGTTNTNAVASSKLTCVPIYRNTSNARPALRIPRNLIACSAFTPPAQVLALVAKVSKSLG